MEGQKKTAVSKLFEYLENEEYGQAKSMLKDVYAEIKLLQQESLHPTANEALKKLDILLKNIECGQRNIIFGKQLTVKAAFVGHLEERLKAITGCEPNARIPAVDTRQREIQSNQEEKELQIERSKRASKALRDGNPDIADLSNDNRPTKIAERFSELYDNEWTEAFETMTKRRTFEELDGIKILLNIVEGAYKFCKPADKGGEKKQIEILQSKFWDETLRENHLDQLNDDEIRKNIKSYAKRCVELCWWMWTHSPSVYMVPTRDYFDSNLYRAYTKSGSIPDFFVWPALKLYKEGGLLAKGVVQYK